MKCEVGEGAELVLEILPLLMLIASSIVGVNKFHREAREENLQLLVRILVARSGSFAYESLGDSRRFCSAVFVAASSKWY